jgi:hypothetical protein
MDDGRRDLPYAPYLMFMIERVTGLRYPKDGFHKPTRSRRHGERQHLLIGRATHLLMRIYLRGPALGLGGVDLGRRRLDHG